MRWQDAPLAKQGPRQVREVFAPKVCGAGKLAVFAAAWPVAASVLFSSVAGLLGSGGQANYAAANAVIDTWAATQHMQVPHLMCCRLKTRHRLPFKFSIMDFLHWVHPCSLHPLMSGNRCIRICYSFGSTACAGLAQHQRAVGRVGRSGHGQQQARACRPSGALGTGPPATPGGSVCPQPYDAAGSDPCRCVSTA